MILRVLPVGRIQANCYVVSEPGSPDALVVDPGDEVERIASELRALELRPAYVFVTHHHLDHSGGVAEFLHAFPDAQFAMHEADYGQIAASVPSAPMWYGRPIEAPRAPDRFLADGDTLEVAGHTFEAIHAPGHTPGSVCLYNAEGDGVVFTGDVLFAGSIGRSDFPGGDHATLIRSIRTRLLTLPDSTNVLPGHLGPSTIERERRSNPLLQGEG